MKFSTTAIVAALTVSSVSAFSTPSAAARSPVQRTTSSLFSSTVEKESQINGVVSEEETPAPPKMEVAVETPKVEEEEESKPTTPVAVAAAVAEEEKPAAAAAAPAPSAPKFSETYVLGSVDKSRIRP
jgi:hypothetical protein